MPPTYAQMKTVVIDVVDDCSDFDVIANYGAKYSAKTKLATLGISSPLKAFMTKPFNKRMRKLVGNAWQPVGPIDIMPITTIGKLIERACGQSGIALPPGEPK